MSKVARRNLPDVSEDTKQIGDDLAQCDLERLDSATISSILYNSQKTFPESAKDKKSLVITTEMKNYAIPLSLGKIESCYKKVMKFKATFFDPEPSFKKHVHFLFTTMKADWKGLKPEAKRAKTADAAEDNIALNTENIGIDTQPPPDLKETSSELLAETKVSSEILQRQVEITNEQTPVNQTKRFPGCRFFVTEFDREKCKLCFVKYVVPSEEKVDKGQTTEPIQNMGMDLDNKIPKVGQNLTIDKGQPTEPNQNMDMALDNKIAKVDHKLVADTDNLVDIIIMPLETLFGHRLL